MAIALAGLFDYVTVIPADREEPPWILGQHARDRRPLEGDPLIDDRLVGVNPTFDISDGTVTLTAESCERASCQAASFAVAPGLLSCVCAEDVLHLVRTAGGGVGLSLIRGTRPILAVGSITTLPLGPVVARNGPHVSLDESPPLRERASLPFWSPGRWFGRRDQTALNRASVPGLHTPHGPGITHQQAHEIGAERRPQTDTWFEVTVGTETRVLGEQEEATIDEYGVFVERSWRRGIPAVDEAVAIYRSGDTIRDVAIESARCLAKAHRGIRLVDWSPHPPKTILTLRKNDALCHAVLYYEQVSVESLPPYVRGGGSRQFLVSPVECRFVRDGEVLSRQRFEFPQDAIEWARWEREEFQRQGWTWQR